MAVPSPSFGFLHAVELNVPVGCGDIAIYPADIVVGDEEGVVVIPRAMVHQIAIEAYEQTRYDAFASEQIAAGRSVVGLYPSTDASRAEFLAWSTGRERRE